MYILIYHPPCYLLKLKWQSFNKAMFQAGNQHVKYHYKKKSILDFTLVEYRLQSYSFQINAMNDDKVIPTTYYI